MPLIYAFVARGPTVLAEHTSHSGNFATVAAETLPKMIEKLQVQKKMTLQADGHTFNYLESDGFVFLMVADEAFGRQVPFSVLDRIAAEFAASYGERARDAIAHSLNRSFAPVLKQHMDAASNDAGEHSKVARVQQQVSEVKEIMMDNIEKVLDRGEKIELLVDKTENLRFQADNFHRTGRALRRRMWWQNLKMKLVFAAFVLIVILILFLSFCYSNGNDCTKKKD